MPEARFPREHRAGHTRVEHKLHRGGRLGGSWDPLTFARIPGFFFQASLGLVLSQGGWLAACARGENSLRRKKCLFCSI